MTTKKRNQEEEEEEVSNVRKGRKETVRRKKDGEKNTNGKWVKRKRQED